jgi:hypothetical protein
MVNKGRSLSQQSALIFRLHHHNESAQACRQMSERLKVESKAGDFFRPILFNPRVEGYLMTA